MTARDGSRGALPGLTDRVNLAFEALRPRGREPYSNSEVAQWVAVHATAGKSPVTVDDLAAVRAGRSPEQLESVLDALAEFFEVPSAFFLADDDTAAAVHDDLHRLVAARALVEWVRT